jgi:hypothetical protein
MKIPKIEINGEILIPVSQHYRREKGSNSLFLKKLSHDFYEEKKICTKIIQEAHKIVFLRDCLNITQEDRDKYQEYLTKLEYVDKLPSREEDILKVFEEINRRNKIREKIESDMERDVLYKIQEEAELNSLLDGLIILLEIHQSWFEKIFLKKIN